MHYEARDGWGARVDFRRLQNLRHAVLRRRLPSPAAAGTAHRVCQICKTSISEMLRWRLCKLLSAKAVDALRFCESTFSGLLC